MGSHMLIGVDRDTLKIFLFSILFNSVLLEKYVFTDLLIFFRDRKEGEG